MISFSSPNYSSCDLINYHTRTYARLCMYIHVYICTYARVYVVYIRVRCVCMYIYVCIYVYACVYVCVYVYVCVCLYVYATDTRDGQMQTAHTLTPTTEAAFQTAPSSSR